MRVGLIVDSACDLPYEFTQKHGIFVLPVTARIDHQTYIDDHDPNQTARFYSSGLLQKGHHAQTEAFSSKQIHDLLMEEVFPRYDFAICETVASSRSLVYQNAVEAMNIAMSEYRAALDAAGEKGNFSMRVVDSRQIFSGQAVLAAHTQRLIDQQVSKNVLRHEVDKFTDKIYTCVIPRDLHYVRERARLRGDKSISALMAFLCKALNITPIVFGQGADGKPAAKTRGFDAAVERVMNYAVGRVQAGLLTPYVCLSCSMSRAEIENLPGLDRLRETCRQEGVELLESQMGIASSIYVGPGSLCLALGAESHEFSDFQ